ncbi:LOW QUALITY PROTEIN: scarecrow-like protein 8 [Ananas comosus]|uniref:LOW QUALITY PROTEIN: scarecrow-like protein 8 n=1 Tax=Ananas comosus TaxID=4615 RepID=A0A6P5FAK4_ANACO|nr:LOW QUALITY PROTEIN: scarecrow-like protein 8 [Ananas comosus]
MALQQALFLRLVRPRIAAVPTESDSESNRCAAMRSQLRELERRLLDDDAEEEEKEDAEEEEASACDSAVTSAEWGEAMQLQRLMSKPNPAQNPLSPSPSNSSSSSSSSTSTASCSPPSSSSSPAKQLLSDAAAAIADGKLDAAAARRAEAERRRRAARSSDAQRRLMAAALAARLGPCPAHPLAELCGAEHRAATQMLHELHPCFRLGLLAANLAVLDAARDRSGIHVLDFDVGGGGAQHAALIRALAERRAPGLRITAVFDPTSPFTPAAAAGALAVGDRLVKLAERAGVGLRFSVVSRRAAELDAAALGCVPGEALAVNLAFALSRVPDESVSPANPRDELLRRVRALRPRVVALVERDMNANTAPFAARFAEACAHYGALLESLDAAAASAASLGGAAERARVEAALAAQRRERRWRGRGGAVERCGVSGSGGRMGMAGFGAVPLGPGVVEPVRTRLGSIRPNPGFTIKEEAGGIGFAWMGRVLTFASAWR